ncbi:MAG: DUF3096 domain-containing protein [Nanoarchaeota archaeon]
MALEIIGGKIFIAVLHMIFGILVLVFPNFLRFWIGLYFILLGLLYLL